MGSVLKGFCPGTGGTFDSDQPILASFWSYPKSFRIWSFQTGPASRFQVFGLKFSHLGEILVQSWKLGAEFGILAHIHKGSPLYTNSSARTEPFKQELDS